MTSSAEALMDPDWRTFGERMRRCRLAVNKTKPDLARDVGIPVDTIYRYERGDFYPSEKRLVDIARAIRTTADYLLYGDDE